jgi:Spy/CpxP family protein refolding chaperone
MTITRRLTTLTTAAALAATALGPMATTACAEGWRDGGRDHSYARSERRDWDRGGRDHWRYRYAHRRHHDNTGKYIALGVGALMLGIIASEAAHH